MDKRIKAEHEIIYARGNDTLFGYFGWPSVCRIGEHDLMVAASGFRTSHIDPFGKSACFFSHDDGRTWSEPAIVNDSPVDDRDTGLVALGDGDVLLSWFASDTRGLVIGVPKSDSVTRQYRMDFLPILADWDDAVVAANVGAFTRLRHADGTWSRRRVSPVSAPHGPVRLRDGRLFYLGNECRHELGNRGGVRMAEITAFASCDAGASWSRLGTVPNPEAGKFWEAHALDLGNGEILGALRHEPGFSIRITRSADGGRTWSVPEFLAYGAPPALMRHSSGVIVMSYSWRQEGYGQRVAFSCDDGRSWTTDWIIRDDGPDRDLGYPTTVELADGSLYTVYYQKPSPCALNCGLMASRWRLPEL